MNLSGQQRLVIAMFLMAAVMFVYYTFFAPKTPKEPAPPSPATGETAAPAPATGAPAPAAPAPPPVRPAEIPAPVRTGARAVVTTPLYTATFEDAGLVGLALAAYPPDPDQLLLTRLGEAAAPPYQPLVRGGETARWEVDRTQLRLGPGDRGKITFRLVEGEATLAQAEYAFRGDDYEVAARVVAGEEEAPVALSLGSFASVADDPRETKDISVEALIGTDKKRDKLSGKDEVKVYTGDVPWAALRSQYFIIAAVAPQGGEVTVTRTKNVSIAGTYLLKRGGDYRIYFGPKRYDRLKEFGVGLERTVDLGWSFIGIIAALMLRLMHLLNRVVANYGVTILIFSLIIKLLTYWPTAAQLKQSQRMQAIQPVMKELREKYKNDPQRLNAEMMGLYKKYKINPLGGCLPLLIQMPILYGMFMALRNAVELKGAPFVLWITDLSQPDVLFELPFTIPLVNISSFNVLPLLMTALWLLQNKFMSPGGAVRSEQQKLMTWLPVIFLFFFYNMPSGLVLYWASNSLFSMLQMLLMKFTAGSKEATA